MISYRPTPELPAGRTGFRAALGAMVLAAVLGTTAFVPTAFVPTAFVPVGADPLPAEDRAVATVQAAVSAGRTVVRRQDGPPARDTATGRPPA